MSVLRGAPSLIVSTGLFDVDVVVAAAKSSRRIAASSALNLKTGVVVEVVVVLVGVLVRTNVGTRGLERTVEVRIPAEDATNGVGRNNKLVVVDVDVDVDVVGVVNVVGVVSMSDVVDVVAIMRVDGRMIGVQSSLVAVTNWRPERISSVLVPSSASSSNDSVESAWMSCVSLATMAPQLNSKSKNGPAFITIFFTDYRSEILAHIN